MTGIVSKVIIVCSSSSVVVVTTVITLLLLLTDSVDGFRECRLHCLHRLAHKNNTQFRSQFSNSHFKSGLMFPFQVQFHSVMTCLYVRLNQMIFTLLFYICGQMHSIITFDL